MCSSYSVCMYASTYCMQPQYWAGSPETGGYIIATSGYQCSQQSTANDSECQFVSSIYLCSYKMQITTCILSMFDIKAAEIFFENDDYICTVSQSCACILAYSFHSFQCSSFPAEICPCQQGMSQHIGYYYCHSWHQFCRTFPRDNFSVQLHFQPGALLLAARNASSWESIQKNMTASRTAT